MVAAFRILSVVLDRFVFYGLVGFAWKSWQCARVGLSRNETRALLSIIIFTAGSDLLWLATEAEGKSVLPTLTFRTAFYLYVSACCVRQGQQIGRHVRTLEALATGSEEMGAKLRRCQTHLRAHRYFQWFGGCFGVYSVGALAAASLGMVPRAVPASVWDEAGYLLMYAFLAGCILNGLVH